MGVRTGRWGRGQCLHDLFKFGGLKVGEPDVFKEWGIDIPLAWYFCPHRWVVYPGCFSVDNVFELG